jgi:ribosomal protein S27AE
MTEQSEPITSFEPVDFGNLAVEMTRTERFACSRCGSKWTGCAAVIDCPRCGLRAEHLDLEGAIYE